MKTPDFKMLPAPLNSSQKTSVAHLTGACPVQFFAEDERSLPRETGLILFNWGEFNRGFINNKREVLESYLYIYGRPGSPYREEGIR